MRCTKTLCQSGNTHLLTRTLVLHYDDQGHVVGAELAELWMCYGCGNPFKPGVSRVPEWNVDLPPYRKPPTKAAINRELFRPAGSR